MRTFPHPQSTQSAASAPRTTSQPATPPAWLMLCLMLGPFINIVDYNVVNVSLPKMMSGLGADVLTIRWVVTAYLIATAVIMPTLGWLGRTIGNKNLYISGLALFTAASALCGLAPNVETLIALRALQGLGAGVLMPISMILMTDVYPPHKRGMGTAVWGIGASMGSAIGLPLGGYFADAVDWRTVFYVNMLPGIVAIVLTLWLVPAAKREARTPFDGWGFLTLSIALVSLLVALSEGQQEGWTSSYLLTLFTLSGIAFALFFLATRRAAEPLLDLALYTSRRYISGTLVAFTMGVFFYSSTFLLVLFAQLLLDYSVQDTALSLLPGAAAMVVTSPFVGWLIDRIEPRVSMLLGLTLFIVGCYMMVLADLRIGFMFIIWVYIFRGLGLGFLYPPVYMLGISGLPPHRTRAATSMLNLWLILGGTFSIALLSTLLERWQTIHQIHFAETQVLTSAGTQQALAAFARLSGKFGSSAIQMEAYARGLLQGIVRREALVHALNDAFALVLVVALFSMAISLCIRRSQS